MFAPSNDNTRLLESFDQFLLDEEPSSDSSLFTGHLSHGSSDNNDASDLFSNFGDSAALALGGHLFPAQLEGYSVDTNSISTSNNEMASATQFPMDMDIALDSTAECIGNSGNNGNSYSSVEHVANSCSVAAVGEQQSPQGAFPFQSGFPASSSPFHMQPVMPSVSSSTLSSKNPVQTQNQQSQATPIVQQQQQQQQMQQQQQQMLQAFLSPNWMYPNPQQQQQQQQHLQNPYNAALQRLQFQLNLSAIQQMQSASNAFILASQQQQSLSAANVQPQKMAQNNHHPASASMQTPNPLATSPTVQSSLGHAVKKNILRSQKVERIVYNNQSSSPPVQLGLSAPQTTSPLSLQLPQVNLQQNAAKPISPRIQSLHLHDKRSIQSPVSPTSPPVSHQLVQDLMMKNQNQQGFFQLSPRQQQQQQQQQQIHSPRSAGSQQPVHQQINSPSSAGNSNPQVYQQGRNGTMQQLLQTKESQQQFFQSAENTTPQEPNSPSRNHPQSPSAHENGGMHAAPIHPMKHFFSNSRLNIDRPRSLSCPIYLPQQQQSQVNNDATPAQVVPHVPVSMPGVHKQQQQPEATLAKTRRMQPRKLCATGDDECK